MPLTEEQRRQLMAKMTSSWGTQAPAPDDGGMGIITPSDDGMGIIPRLSPVAPTPSDGGMGIRPARPTPRAPRVSVSLASEMPSTSGFRHIAAPSSAATSPVSEGVAEGQDEDELLLARRMANTASLTAGLARAGERIGNSIAGVGGPIDETPYQQMEARGQGLVADAAQRRKEVRAMLEQKYNRDFEREKFESAKGHQDKQLKMAGDEAIARAKHTEGQLSLGRDQLSETRRHHQALEAIDRTRAATAGNKAAGVLDDRTLAVPGFRHNGQVLPQKTEVKAFRSSVAGMSRLERDGQELLSLYTQVGPSKVIPDTVKGRIRALLSDMDFAVKDKEGMGALQSGEIQMIRNMFSDPLTVKALLLETAGSGQAAEQIRTALRLGRAGVTEGARLLGYDRDDGPGTAQAPSQEMASAGAVPSISSDAEYDALPSGARFVGPDGVRRRKP